MSSRRTLKAASAIREVVSMAILTELRDPRIANVTVTGVEISADMRSAKVYVSIMGSPKQQDLCMHGLQRSAGYLQKRVNDRIETRYTPRIQFELDQGIKRSFEVAEILREVLPPGESAPNELSFGQDPDRADDVDEDGLEDNDLEAFDGDDWDDADDEEEDDEDGEDGEEDDDAESDDEDVQPDDEDSDEPESGTEGGGTKRT